VIIGASNAHRAAMTALQLRKSLTTLAVTRPLPLQSRPATTDAGPQCVVEGRIRNVAAVIIGASNAHGAAMTAPEPRQRLTTLAVSPVGCLFGAGQQQETRILSVSLKGASGQRQPGL